MALATRMGIRVPTGAYDPALDAQQRAAHRGYLDTTQDIEQGGQRANTDFAVNRSLAQQRYGTSLADILRSRSEREQDYSTANQRFQQNQGTRRAREGQDYTRNIEGIQRGYRRLGDTQGQQAAQMGVTRGGTLAAALAARQENEGIDRAPVDQQHQRFGQDMQRADLEHFQDFQTNWGRDLANSQRAQMGLESEYNDANTGLFSRMNTGYQRGVDDRAIDQSRAGRELGFYDQDVAEQRLYQAAQMGWTPPPAAARDMGNGFQAWDAGLTRRPRARYRGIR